MNTHAAPSAPLHSPSASASISTSNASISPVLVIGGTGMLLPAVQTLVGRGERVLVIVRRPERAGSHGLLRAIRGDWADAAGLLDAIRRELQSENEGNDGPIPQIHKAIIWVHEPHATQVHEALGSILARDALVVHVVGSSRGNPRSDPIPGTYASPRQYRRVILGFKGVSGQTRWLTDEEISEGAVKALDWKSEEGDGEEKKMELIVGRIEPWEDHP